jgi:hypothetical protein
MIATMRARVLSIALGAVLCLTLGLSSAAQAASDASIHYESESLQAYEQQLHSSQIASVVINKRLRSLRITLKNGQHVKARYAAHQEPAVVKAIEAKNIPVTVLSPTEAQAEAKSVPKHHKLRYIAGAAVIVVIAIVGGVLYIRRKRGEEDDE